MKLDWLSGVRVLVLGHYVPAPLAAWLLQILGAEVIKIEPPTGDFMRLQPPFWEGSHTRQSALFQTLNAGTQSIALNLRHPQGVEVLKDLMAQSPILIDGNRAGFLEKLLGTTVEQLFPHLSHIMISGLGNHGPMREHAAHDNNALALAGVLSYTTPSSEAGPAPFSAPVADILAGFTAALCAVASLQQKNSLIKQVDTSLLHSAFFFNLLQLPAQQAIQQNPIWGNEWMNGGFAQYRPYPTSDGKFVFFGPIEPHLLSRFLQVIQRIDLIESFRLQPQFAAGQLSEVFRSKPIAFWQQLGETHDICLTPVLSIEEALQHPQIQALGLAHLHQHPEFGPMALPVFPAGFGPGSTLPDRPMDAPEIGSHSRTICCDLLGHSPAQFAEWLADGVVYEP